MADKRSCNSFGKLLWDLAFSSLVAFTGDLFDKHVVLHIARQSLWYLAYSSSVAITGDLFGRHVVLHIVRHTLVALGTLSVGDFGILLKDLFICSHS